MVREGAIPRAVIDEVNVTTILFVCTGNTCRSPMAEAIARKMLADRLKLLTKLRVGHHPISIDKSQDHACNKCTKNGFESE